MGKIFQNREEHFRIKKNISELRKIFENWKKYFKIEKKSFRIEKYFVASIEKKTLELNVFTNFLHNSFIVYIRLVIVKSCFAQNATLKFGSKYHLCSTSGHRTRSELGDSVALQLQDAICEKCINWNYFQAGYCYEVIVMFL